MTVGRSPFFGTSHVFPSLVHSRSSCDVANISSFQEIDPAIKLEESEWMEAGSEGLISEIISSVPGIDEAMSFAELLKYVQGDQYSTIVFDTAPTGHTLRLLSFPSILEKALNKLMSIKNRFSGLFSQMTGMIGASSAVPSEEQLLGKLETMKAMIEDVNRQFQDPKLTTFICVCIPEFLSLFETERLIQELAKFGIDVHNVVVNQVLFPEAGACRLRSAPFFLRRRALGTKISSRITLSVSIGCCLRARQVPTAASAWRAHACRKSTSIRSLTCTRTFTSFACRCSTRRCAACPRCASTARTCSCRSTPPRRRRARAARAEMRYDVVRGSSGRVCAQTLCLAWPMAARTCVVLLLSMINHYIPCKKTTISNRNVPMRHRALGSFRISRPL